MFSEFIFLLRNPYLRPHVLRRWLLWTTATTLGWFLAGAAGLPVGRVIVMEGGWQAILPAVLPLGALAGLAGAFIGLIQWFALRRMASVTMLWVVAAAIGWGLGLPLGLLINLSGVGLFAILYGLFAGLLAAGLQSLWSRSLVAVPSRWIAINLLAHPLALLLGGFFQRTMLTATNGQWGISRLQSGITGAAGGLLAGILTGMVMVLWITQKAGDDG